MKLCITLIIRHIKNKSIKVTDLSQPRLDTFSTSNKLKITNQYYRTHAADLILDVPAGMLLPHHRSVRLQDEMCLIFIQKEFQSPRWFV